MMRRTAIAELRDRPGPIALAVGFFDGVHRGHRAVMESARHLAGDDGEAWALTFDPHPLAILRPELAPPLLSSLEHKLALAQRAGLDGCVVLPFSHELAAQSPEEFAGELTRCTPGLQHVVCGANWRFGHRAKGHPELLAELGRPDHLAVTVVEAVVLEGTTISSTRIRAAVQAGHLAEAELMLGRPFGVLADVVHGRGVGRQLGYPSANLDVHGEVLPPLGIYTACALIDGVIHPGVLSYGVRPTYPDSVDEGPVAELHLFDFEADLYGARIEVFFGRFLRAELTFATSAELTAQIDADVILARRVLTDESLTKKVKDCLYTAATRVL